KFTKHPSQLLIINAIAFQNWLLCSLVGRGGYPYSRVFSVHTPASPRSRPPTHPKPEKSGKKTKKIKIFAKRGGVNLGLSTMNQPIIPTPTVQTSNILDEYADIRWQIAALSAKLEEIEPMAIEQALSIINEGATANGQRVVYRTDTIDIILQLRSQKPKPESHADLESLKQLIELEAEKAQYQNQEEIALMERDIAILRYRLLKLEQTDEGRTYQTEYGDLERQLTTLKPLLSVRLK
ncbi:MAG: hypothetical protein ACKO1G_12870, partial [Microcystis aeruginosa]